MERPNTRSSRFAWIRDVALRRAVIEAGLLTLLVLSPLPAASTDDWAVLIIELAAIGLTALYFLPTKQPPVEAKPPGKLGRLKYVFGALLLWVGIQLLPLPMFILRILSPRAVALRQDFLPRFAEMKFFSLTLVPSATLREALELLSYVLIGFLVVKTITRRRQIRRMMTVLVAMGAFEAVYGLFELSRKNPRVLFYKKIYNLDSATGTFINRNHFSGYLELILPLAIGLLLSRLDVFGPPGRKWRDHFSQARGKELLLDWLLLGVVVVISLGILLSHSRSGIFLLLLALVIFVEMAVFHFSQVRYRQAWVRSVFIGAFLLVTAVALYIGIESTVGRFSLDNLLQDGRPRLWSNVLAIVRDFPLFGTGLGTFPSAFPVYETISFDGMALVHAHNDYLEFLSELGVIGFLLLAGAVLWMAGGSFQAWSKRKSPEIKALALGAIIAIFLMLVHSLTDFNLHIPANLLLFSVVLGLAQATVHYRKA